MTPTEMHIDALIEKIEDLELKISLMIDPIVFNSMSAEYADHLSRLSDQNKKLEAENVRFRSALERIENECSRHDTTAWSIASDALEWTKE